MNTSPEFSLGPAGQPPRPPADDDLPGREVRFLCDVAQLAADRSSAETQIEAQYRARMTAAESALHDGRQSLTAQLKVDRADLESDYAEQRRHALARYELDTAALDGQLAELQAQAAADYDRSTKRAARKLKEARWEADTLYEASKGDAPRKLKDFQDNLQTLLGGLHAERHAAQLLLNAWRQPWPDDTSDDEETPAMDVADAIAKLKERVEFVAVQRALLAQLRLPVVAARLAPAWIIAISGLLAAFAALAGLGVAVAGVALVVALGAGFAAIVYLRSLARAQIVGVYPPMVEAMQEAERFGRCAWDAARQRTAADQATVVDRHQDACAAAEAKYKSRIERAARRRDTRLQGPALSYPQHMAEIEARRDRDLELAEGHRARRYEEIQGMEADGSTIAERHTLRTEQIRRNHAIAWQTLIDQWKAGLERLHATAEKIRSHAAHADHNAWLADWGHIASQGWSPAAEVPTAIRFGQFRVTMDQVPSGRPADPRLAELTPEGFTLPAVAAFPAESSLLFKTHGAGRRVAVEAMQAFMLRLLVSLPPGKLRFTIIDPIGLGENFAAFMHLADYNEQMVNSRIWTDPRHIEQRLADLAEHMENVIQKYLRNEFPTLEAYNQQAGEIAEPYRYLVVADFPANFSEAAVRRLLSIAGTGPRCGVYTIIMADTKSRLPPGISLANLEQGTTLVWRQDRYVWQDERFGSFALSLDTPPPPAEFTSMLHAAGTAANDASRVEVPFEVIAPAEDERWTTSAQRGIDVPLGRAGATRLQSLKLGQGTSQHVLVAGKTGSGKSTLLHALITNLALRYTPDEVELYLVDFKQGVEFKTYAAHQLPHARVVAVESDREFGVSVLARLDAELKLRADRFRALGVQDLAGARDADRATPMPRILLVVDEFQEFFVEDDKNSQDAGLLLDRLVRQGRAFGIHVLLGSQTLAGTYSLARSTIGQMAVRIALQCSESDAHLILSEDNSAARLLSRAGEAIYNDSNGLVEGNHPFQIVWLPDERRETYLEEVRSLAKRHGYVAPPQVVFEGNVPADPQANAALAGVLAAGRPAVWPHAPTAWLGEAVAIKDPTAVTFRRQSGNNVLAVGQNIEAALGTFASMIVGLAAQSPPAEGGGPRIYIFDGSLGGSGEAASLALLADVLDGVVRVVARRDVPAVVDVLSAEIARRQEAVDEEFPPIFVFVYGLQKLRDLRRGEDDFGFSRATEDAPPDPSKQFTSILREGPALAVYSIVWCDSVNNVSRTWDRQTLREFELRIAFQMSAADSSTFIDSPQATRLGVNRALLHSEEQGTLEKFRPYRPPSVDWLEHVRRQLHVQATNGSGVRGANR